MILEVQFTCIVYMGITKQISFDLIKLVGLIS